MDRSPKTIPELWVSEHHGGSVILDSLTGRMFECNEAGARIWQPWGAIDVRRSPEGHICTIETKDGDSKRSSRKTLTLRTNQQRNQA